MTPTNDLDLETLDLLQEVIAEYEGTVLLISHDRDFLNRIVDTSIILTGQGEFVKIAGSWEEYNKLKAKNETQNKGEFLDKKKNVSKSPKGEMPSKAEFSFVDKHRLNEIPNLMDRLEYEIKQLETFLSDSNLYLEHPNKFEKASAALIERQAEMKKLEDEWFKLEEKATH